MHRKSSIFLLFLSLKIFAAEAPVETIFFSCRVNQTIPTHLVHLELNFATKETPCFALAVDARGGIEGHTYNSNWKCEPTEIRKLPRGRETLIKLRVEKAKGIGEEQQRFDDLLLLMDTETLNGGGFATKLNGERSPVTCQREANGPPRVDSLNP